MVDGELEIVVFVESVFDVGKDYLLLLFFLFVGREINNFWIKVYVIIKDEDGVINKWLFKV